MEIGPYQQHDTTRGGGGLSVSGWGGGRVERVDRWGGVKWGGGQVGGGGQVAIVVALEDLTQSYHLNYVHVLLSVSTHTYTEPGKTNLTTAHASHVWNTLL